jgi:uncharacterized membrane protein (Fun14 family)
VNLFFRRIAAAVPGAVGREMSDGPWRAKTVLAAAAIALLGLGLWFNDAVKGHPATEPGVEASDAASPATSSTPSNWSKPMPGYVRVCVSYIGGFLLGWAFRRFIKLAIAGTALIIALLALGRFVGCDTAQTQEQVKRGGAWVQREAAETRDYLKGRLPSAAAGGTGLFFGFRRRGRATTPASPQAPPDGPPPAP